MSALRHCPPQGPPDRKIGGSRTDDARFPESIYEVQKPIQRVVPRNRILRGRRLPCRCIATARPRRCGTYGLLADGIPGTGPARPAVHFVLDAVHASPPRHGRMTDTKDRSIVICGLPASGKTTFLAALWHVVFQRADSNAKLKFE